MPEDPDARHGDAPEGRNLAVWILYLAILVWAVYGWFGS